MIPPRALLFAAAAAGGAIAAPAVAQTGAEAVGQTIVVTAPMGRATGWSAPVANPELATMRGGVLLPNGLDIRLGIDIETRVNGILVLHTIYASDGPIIGTRLFRDGASPSAPVPSEASAQTPASNGTPAINVTRAPGGVTIAPGATLPAANVRLLTDPASIWIAADGQQQVPVTPGGPAVDTDQGTYGLTTGPSGNVASLTTPDLTIQHLIGQATGLVISNSGNDRAIETVSTLDIAVGGIMPGLVSGQFLANTLAREAMVGR